MIRKHSAVLSQYIISYLIIALLACSIVGLSLFYIASSALTKAAEETRQRKLDMAVQDLERQYEILSGISTHVAVTSYYRQNFMNASEINKWRMMEDFAAYASYSPIVTTYFLYRRPESVVWKTNAMNTYDYYAGFVLQAPDPDELKSQLDKISEPTIYRLTEVASLCLFPIYIDANRAASCDAVVGFLIEQSSVASRLADIMVDIDAAVQLEYQNQPLFTFEQEADISAVDWQNNRHVLRAKQADGHFTLAMLNSTGQVMTELASFRIISAVIIILSVVLIASLGFYLAKRNYRPIRELAKRYDHDSDGGSGNEIQRIDRIIHTAIEKNRLTEDKMNEQLRSLTEQKDMLVQQFFHLVLAGEYSQDIGKAADELGIRFISDHFVVFLLCPAQPDHVDAASLIKLVNQLSDDCMTFYGVYMAGKNMLAVIVCAEDARLFDEAAELIDELQREEKLTAAIRRGTACRDAKNLPVALASALAATETAKPEWPAARKENNHSLLFDMIAFLRCGDIDRAHEKLNAYVDLLAAETPSALHRYYAFADSLMLLIRSVDDANIPAMPEKVGKILLSNSFEDFRQGASQLLDELNTALQKNESVQHIELENQVIEYIQAHAFDSALDFTRISDQFDLSAKTIRQIVRNQTGKNLREMLNAIRIRHAQELLVNSRLSIAEIAQNAGYLSVSYFIKNFRSHTGLTPARYRESHP